MRTKQEMAVAHRKNIANSMLSAIVDELFEEQQDYTDCLNILKNQELSIKDSTYVLGRTPNEGWTLSKHGVEDWLIRFNNHNVDDRNPSSNVQVVHNQGVTATLITDLTDWVVEILSSYHPNGEPLTFEFSKFGITP